MACFGVEFGGRWAARGLREGHPGSQPTMSPHLAARRLKNSTPCSRSMFIAVGLAWVLQGLPSSSPPEQYRGAVVVLRLFSLPPWPCFLASPMDSGNNNHPEFCTIPSPSTIRPQFPYSSYFLQSYPFPNSPFPCHQSTFHTTPNLILNPSTRTAISASLLLCFSLSIHSLYRLLPRFIFYHISTLHCLILLPDPPCRLRAHYQPTCISCQVCD